MAKISIKNILGKNNEIAGIIGSLNITVWIEDETGKLLFGLPQEGKTNATAVKLEDELKGWVKGNEQSVVIARLLTHLLQKESEKKKLGSEVLNLYQEINMIFNFSEKLAQTIEADSIASATLAQARHIIHSNAGVVVLWDENSKQLQVAASSGELFVDTEKINDHLTVLSGLIRSGQSEIISDSSSLKAAEIISTGIQSIIYAALKVQHRVMGALILSSNELVQYTASDLKLLTTLALQSSSAIESALLYEKNIKEVIEREEAIRRVYEVTAKFVPYEFIDALGHKTITDVKLGDQVEKIVTVLFSDIREYTTLAEQMTPEENFRFICSFNETMGPIIRKYNGFINQYLGDAIMAIFPGKAEDALLAAVAMQKQVQEFNKTRLLNNEQPIKIGVGMHTGPLIMGITGDQDRLDATTIADTVNTASRLESLTKYYKGDIIVSEATVSQISSTIFHLRPLGSVKLKGKHEPVNIHECFSGYNEEEIKKMNDALPDFNAGISCYLSSSFEEAATAFQHVLATNPEDDTASFFLHKATGYLKNGAPANWFGVEEMHNK